MPKAPSATGVYYLIDGGRVVYIGSSTNIRNRLQKHSETKEFSSVNWTVTGNKTLARHLEAYELSSYKSKHGELPKYNKNMEHEIDVTPRTVFDNIVSPKYPDADNFRPIDAEDALNQFRVLI